MASRRAHPGKQDTHAPTYSIPTNELVAVEHPATIRNLERGLATFGRSPDFRSIIEYGESPLCLPLYLRPSDIISTPILSQNAPTHSLLLEVTVPKRTGRKRKRGTNAPWEGDSGMADAQVSRAAGEPISRLDLDDARVLRRKLHDNKGKYKAEVVGKIRNTHRYRGIADYQQSTENSLFMKSFIEKVMPQEISRLREFKVNPGLSRPPAVDVIPPPTFTTQTLPWNYEYTQNPYVRQITNKHGGSEAVNITAAVGSAGWMIKFDDPAPTGPSRPPKLNRPSVRAVLDLLHMAMDERPIWTRRSIINRLAQAKGADKFSSNTIKKCISYVGYQFNGGPFRDALVKYGLDPRLDPEYRIYQTLLFKTKRTHMGHMGQPWHTIRAAGSAAIKTAPSDNTPQDSHLFDGQSFCEDGKVWQVCDVTDPMLAKIFADAPVRPEFDNTVSGWYHQGTWIKAKAIMRSKMQAMQFGRPVRNEDYIKAMAVPDLSPRLSNRTIAVPLPDLGLTAEEQRSLETRKYHNTGGGRKRKRGIKYVMHPRETINKSKEAGPAFPGREAQGGDDILEEEVQSPSAQLQKEMQSMVPESVEMNLMDGDDMEVDEDENDNEEIQSDSGEEDDLEDEEEGDEEDDDDLDSQAAEGDEEDDDEGLDEEGYL